MGKGHAPESAVHSSLRPSFLSLILTSHLMEVHQDGNDKHPAAHSRWRSDQARGKRKREQLSNLPYRNCSLTASMTCSGVKPNLFCKDFNGADAPKKCMPRLVPFSPT